MKSSRRLLVRQWALVQALSASRYGLTVRQLTERMRVSKQTLYRDLSTLRESGVPIAPGTVNGEARYRLMRESELPPLGLTALQIGALHLARGQLEPLAGSGLIAEFDALLAKLRPSERQQVFQFAERGAGKPDVMSVIEKAIELGRRARIEYRAASRGGVPTSVSIEPLVIAVADGRPYVRAFCVERDGERTYKLHRIVKAELSEERASHRPSSLRPAVFALSVKAWSGEPTEVQIKLDAEVAWRAEEYPLIRDQSVVRNPDGTALVRARVAGVVETARWVLGWGGAAEALAPAALRQFVRQELAKANRKYRGPARTRGHRASNAAVVTRGTRSAPRAGRLTQGGTREA